MRDQVVLATHNAKKLAELRRIVSALATPATVEILGLDDVVPYPEPAETERSFEGNALLKARACVTATGLPSLADDSGLAVDILSGMPGVRSARWSGPDADDSSNNELLLRQLADVPESARTARFVCAVALAMPDGVEHVETATMDGKLLTSARGDNGFGYDPLFVAGGNSRSNAELSEDEKDAISHRGRALRAIVPVLLDELRRRRGEG
jgi:XTP/dITP diphosphohydrolase